MARILSRDGNLVVVDFGGAEQRISKRQLAQQIDRSIRWVEQMVAKGMPSTTDNKGRRRFLFSEVQQWRTGKPKPEPMAPTEEPDAAPEQDSEPDGEGPPLAIA